jgi:hypothetical protein
MAGIARSGELRAQVIGIRSFLIIRQVASGAVGRETLKLTDGRAFMAILAWHRRMSTKKRKAILVIADLFYGNLPA